MECNLSSEPDPVIPPPSLKPPHPQSSLKEEEKNLAEERIEELEREVREANEKVEEMERSYMVLTFGDEGEWEKKEEVKEEEARGEEIVERSWLLKQMVVMSNKKKRPS